MTIFFRRANCWTTPFLFALLTLASPAQTDSGLSTPGATAHAARALPPNGPATNVPPPPAADFSAGDGTTNTPETAAPVTVIDTNPGVATPPAATPQLSAPVSPAVPARELPSPTPSGSLFGPLLVLTGLGGLIAYFCGLTRAKNCGHTCTVILLGAIFGLGGFWICGFAVLSGGLDDPHAALTVPLPSAPAAGLDHELGFYAAGHRFGFMGSAGFFLDGAEETRPGMATLFFGQATLLILAVGAALGGSLERVRFFPLALAAFLAGALIVPLVGNWTWGGGWLAQLGHDAGLGHGVVDLGGAGVIHLAAGMLALVLTLQLGPRYGRFGRNGAVAAIPGHNLPFVMLGSAALLMALTAINAGSASGGPEDAADGGLAGLAATNTLLAAAGGFAAKFLLVTYRRRPAHPAGLCRGLLGGAVAVSAGAPLLDPWAAIATGAIAAGLIHGTVRWLERRRIDDPAGVIAVHGAGGAWGLLALGLLANGSGNLGGNGAPGPVRGLLLGHDGRQLAAQAIGAVVIFATVFVLGSASIALIQKIIGLRVGVADEASGLDGPKLGALGYRGDDEVETER